MKFTKMHGLGNDFIMIEDMNDIVENKCELSVKLCDRHFGIGADGIILIKKSDTSDIKMDIINSDGSIANMCGNGLRCFARYVYDMGIVKKQKMSVETLAGIMKVELNIENQLVKTVRVDMGSPSFDKRVIPFHGSDDNKGYLIRLDETRYQAVTMLMGVPHTVIFTDDIDEQTVIAKGKIIENMEMFPDKTNVNFVKVTDRKNIQVRTWERGAGYTLACGTGTCASTAACVISGRTDNIVLASLAGGILKVEYNGENVFMEGPAKYVFNGELLQQI